MELFLNFLFALFIVGVQRHNWFLSVDFVSCYFAEFIYYKFLFVGSLGFSTYRILSSANRYFYVFPSDLGAFCYFFFPIYLTGSTALTVSGEHGWHTLEGWWLFVILGICFGHAVTDAFRVCCCLNFDSFASLRWTVTVAIPVALGFEIQKQQPAQNRNQSIGCLTLKNLRKFLKQLMAKRDNAPIK